MPIELARKPATRTENHVSVVRFRPWAPTNHLGRLANCFWLCADAFVRFARCNRFASNSPKNFFWPPRVSAPRGIWTDPQGCRPRSRYPAQMQPKKTQRYLESKMSASVRITRCDQLTLNQRVKGSSPFAPTNRISHLDRISRPADVIGKNAAHTFTHTFWLDWQLATSSASIQIRSCSTCTLERSV
jgi:hypothetical protein